jgi:ABC-type multidrug transport system fused ATPase/permease subunit
MPFMTSHFTRYSALLRAYLAPQWPRVAALAVLLLAGTGLQVLIPQILRSFVDLATGGASSDLTLAAVLFVGVTLLDQVAWLIVNYLGEQVGWTATNAVRADLAEHLLGLDMSFHNARTPGELIERVDGDPTALASFFSQLVILVLGSALLLLGILAALFREDWRIGLALAAFTVFALLVLHRIRNFAVPYFAADRQSSAEMYGFLEERLAGVVDIHANGAQQHVMRRFHEFMRQRYLRGRGAFVAGTVMFQTADALFLAGYVLALGLGAAFFRGGAITIGTVYLIVHYTTLLRFPLEQITRQLQEFQKASASIGRIQQLLALRSAVGDGDGLPPPRGALSVEFDGVWFEYPEAAALGGLAHPHPPFGRPLPRGEAESPLPVGEGQGEGVLSAGAAAGDPRAGEGVRRRDPALREVSFRLEPGRVLGVLGRTGSGKTTLTRLLFRLYDVSAGAIRVGGDDVRTFRLADLHRAVGIVTQDVQLFDASVRDNLALFDRDVPDERILSVMGDLGLLPWLRALPEGLDTALGQGAGLSAGEAQLLALTRVFLRDPGIVVLDEASSRLDRATEALIEHALDTLLRHRTGVVIAHRLATVQRADDILILEDGAVREWGRRLDLASDPRSRFAALLRAGMEEVLV